MTDDKEQELIGALLDAHAMEKQSLQTLEAAVKVAGDPQLYGFLVKRVALAIKRADSRLGPARAGWGAATLAGVTDNRSLEAHLANFGYDLPYGAGRVDQDPRGYIGTIDPRVDVLRVDRVGPGRRPIPMGGVARLRRPRHGQPLHPRGLQRRPPRAREPDLRGGGAPGRARAAQPGRGGRVRQRRRGRHDRGAAWPRPGVR